MYLISVISQFSVNQLFCDKLHLEDLMILIKAVRERHALRVDLYRCVSINCMEVGKWSSIVVHFGCIVENARRLRIMMV